jgi:hypothetical protein
VRSELNALGHLHLEDARALAAFLTTDAVPVRCFFLFDGLNEVAPPYRDALVDELRHWMADYPRHAVICTSRMQDETWRWLHGEMRAVVVQPVDDGQQKATW